MTADDRVDQRIDVRVLGPVEVRVDGVARPLGGPRQRALLALLALDPGRAVGIDRIIDELWADEPPEAAESALRTCVSRLRTALADPAVIRRSGASYTFAIEPDAVDSWQFRARVREADTAAAERQPHAVAEILREAMTLWRAAPYADLHVDGALRLEAERLDELRLHALESRFEAELALGASAVLLDELEPLVGSHPYREGLWRQLMLALYRSGRQADALAAYHRARRALEEQLGIEPGPELQALEQAILRQEVPAAPTEIGRDPLPEPLTTFVGREAEIRTVLDLVQRSRLVTLTGVGGVGKTRLAIAVAREDASRRRDGVAFVDLSSATERGMVPRIVAEALQIREQADAPSVDALLAGLRDRELLLVLDNCEHLAPAPAELVQALLSACTGVGVLATSRELLGVPGETDVPVQPLGVPEGSASIDELRASDSVRLFLARAGEARHGLADDAGTVARAADICRDLDGLPLAIELAAARARTLSLDEIAERVRVRFQFLVSWRRLTSARHQTLRRAIDWSFDLLTEPEQDLLRGSSVFAGGATLSALAAVCGDGDEDATLGLLERLVASSLVNPVHGAGATRYRLLETVREYAAERLAAEGDEPSLRRRHARHFRELLDEAWAPLRIGDTAVWTDRIAAEHDNLRAALTWARAAGEHDELLRLAEGLWYFWWVHGDLREGREWLSAALAAAGPDTDPILHSRALGGAARLAWAATDLERAAELAAAAWARLPPDAGALQQGILLQTLGVISTAREELPAARRWLEQARDRFASLPAEDPWRRDRLAGAILVLGTVLFFEGDYAGAATHYRDALADCVAREDADGIALCQLYLSHVALLQDDLEESLRLVVSALRRYHRLGWLQYVAECYEIAAFTAHRSGRPAEAVRLIGAADQARERTGTAATLAIAKRRDETLPVLRAAMGDDEYDASLAAGRSLTGEQALMEAEQLLAG
jgi:predicted ATPase/DNA-binding SARP family transcriptional activator